MDAELRLGNAKQEDRNKLTELEWMADVEETSCNVGDQDLLEREDHHLTKAVVTSRLSSLRCRTHLFSTRRAAISSYIVVVSLEVHYHVKTQMNL